MSECTSINPETPTAGLPPRLLPSTRNLRDLFLEPSDAIPDQIPDHHGAGHSPGNAPAASLDHDHAPVLYASSAAEQFHPGSTAGNHSTPMRRTHIMHKRDNRRAFPSHGEIERSGQTPRDSRFLQWVKRSDGAQVMSIDGEAVAEVTPFGQPRYDLLGEWVQPHTARIIDGNMQKEFRTLDEARFFCEKLFSNLSAKVTA